MVRVFGPAPPIRIERTFVETHDNSPHDITLLKILLWAGGMSVVTGDAGIRDGKVGRKPLELVIIFEGENSRGRIVHEFFQRIFLELWFLGKFSL